MSKSQTIIPITQAGSACSSGTVPAAGSSCSSAASCSSSSCSSAGGSAADDADPTYRLQQAGWILHTTIGEPRLSEVVENYRALGYEVHVEYFETTAASDAGEASCTTCYDAADKTNPGQAWGSVYVRSERTTNRNEFPF